MYSDPRLIPIQKAARFNVDGASIDSGTSLLTAAISPSMAPSLFRITVSLKLAAKFKVQLTRDSTTLDLVFNSNTNLVANGMYNFDMLVRSGDSINFEQDADNNTINVLIVQEIPSSI